MSIDIRSSVKEIIEAKRIPVYESDLELIAGFIEYPCAYYGIGPYELVDAICALLIQCQRFRRSNYEK